MALDQDGRRSLKRNGFDPDVARGNGLNEVMKLAPSCPGFPQEQIGETDDLLNVWRSAAKIVGQRDEHQAISIDGFMMALLSDGPSSTLEVIRGAGTPAPLERVLKAIEDAVDRIAHQSKQTTAIEHRLAGIEGAIEGHLRKRGPEPVGVFLQLARVAGFAVLTVGAALAVYLSN